jgi:rRNA biogenesis protein RRP5
MASLKRKSNAADLSGDKSSSKRRRNNAQSARSETSRKKSVGTPLKPDTDSSKSTRPVPISLLTNEQPAFPRGGASILTPIERKQIQAQATRDALKERANSDDLFGTIHRDLDDSGEDDSAEDATKRTKKKRKKVLKKRPTDGGVQEAKALRIEGLSYRVSMLLSIRSLCLTLPKAGCAWIPRPRPDHKY